MRGLQCGQLGQPVRPASRPVIAPCRVEMHFFAAAVASPKLAPVGNSPRALATLGKDPGTMDKAHSLLCTCVTAAAAAYLLYSYFRCVSHPVAARRGGSLRFSAAYCQCRLVTPLCSDSRLPRVSAGTTGRALPEGTSREMKASTQRPSSARWERGRGTAMVSA